MRVYVLVLLIAAVSTYLLVPLVLRVAVAAGAITQLRARDVHTHPTPRLGGLAMYLGLVISFIMASQIPYLGNVFSRDSGAWAVLAGAGVMCLIGVLDDIWELTWYTKLAGEIVAAGVMAWCGVQFVSLPIFGLTIGSMRLTLFATIIVVVLVVNAVNFIDGLDGLAAGVVGIGALAFLFYAYYLTRFVSPGDYSSVATGVVAGLVGICIGFLPHNFHEARIFMGDSGALMLGTVIAGATILVTGQIDPAKVDTAFAVPAYMPILLPVLVLIIPVIDMVWAVVRRLAQGKSPFEADAGHLHHRLLRRGHSHTAAVLVLYMWAGLVSLGSVATVVYPSLLWIPILILAFVVAVIITRRNFGKRFIESKTPDMTRGGGDFSDGAGAGTLSGRSHERTRLGKGGVSLSSDKMSSISSEIGHTTSEMGIARSEIGGTPNEMGGISSEMASTSRSTNMANPNPDVDNASVKSPHDVVTKAVVDDAQE